MAEYSKPMFADETTGYAYNANLNARLTEWHERDYTPKSEPMVRFPLLTVVAFDARPGLIALYEPDTREAEARRAPKDEWGRFNVFFPTVLNESPEGATRHSGGATYLFADGHAKWHKPVEIATGAAHDGVRAGFGL